MAGLGALSGGNAATFVAGRVASYDAFSRLSRSGLVILRKHQRKDAGGLVRIARVFGAVGQLRVIVVDLPKELSAAKLEAAEIVLAVRVVVFIERIEGGDLIERGALHHVGKCVDASGHRDLAA